MKINLHGDALMENVLGSRGGSDAAGDVDHEVLRQHHKPGRASGVQSHPGTGGRGGGLGRRALPSAAPTDRGKAFPLLFVCFRRSDDGAFPCVLKKRRILSHSNRYK